MKSVEFFLLSLMEVKHFHLMILDSTFYFLNCWMLFLALTLVIAVSPSAHTLSQPQSRVESLSRWKSLWDMLEITERSRLVFILDSVSAPPPSSRHELSEYIAAPLFKKQPPQQWVTMVTQHMQQVQALNPHQARAQFMGKVFVRISVEHKPLPRPNCPHIEIQNLPQQNNSKHINQPSHHQQIKTD